MFAGVAVYTAHDIHFTPVGYVWLGIWYSFAVFEMVWVKKVVDTVEMTTWGRTYYQVNCFAFAGPEIVLDGLAFQALAF